MKKPKDGGPAFARSGNEWDEQTWVPTRSFDGMSLRDYFAAKAMGGLLADPNVDASGVHETAYKIADAMLAEREKQQ